MKKAVALVLASTLLVSAGSAALIPSNLTIDLNIDLFGGGDEQKTEDKKKENNTYGKNVGGQAVYTETKPNDPEVQRNSQEYGITEEDTNENNDIAEMISAFIFDIMGKKGGPDTSEPNSVQ